VEVKIGVQNTVREVVLESAQGADEVAKAVADAITAGGVLSLEDEKGRRVIVPVATIGYVEIGEPTVRKVGFGTP
jgi:hypothetical protein